MDQKGAMELSEYHLHFQQDKAPSHYTIAFREWFNAQFPRHGLIDEVQWNSSDRRHQYYLYIISLSI